MSDITIGTILGDRYEILSEVGRGRVGIVYKANHRRLEKLIAIKVLFEEVGKDETSIKRFELEAKASGRLSHPNIIHVLDYGLSRGGFPYLVMEYLDGEDLHNILSAETRLPLGRAVRIMSQVCSALAHAHNRGVIHRDLKPSNIMLLNMEGHPDFVKLVDFGIAKRYDGDEATIEKLTMDGQLLGTPAYMSPEQCQAGKLDARSDIYSLGCVMYKVLTGNAPILGSSIIEIIHNHIGQDPTSFAEACPDVRIPPAIQEVVLTALNKDPSKRHQTMSEFATLLNSAAAASGLAPTPTTSFPVFGQSKAGPPAGGTGFGAPVPFGMGNPFAAQQAAATAAPREDLISASISDADAVYKARKFEQLMESAQKGDARAQFELAIRFQNGDGVDSSREESTKWLRTAAQTGHKEAQYRWGKRLLEGEGVFSAAPAEGFIWLSRSAEQGYEPAQLLVGICHEEGRGTQPDLKKAVHFYRASMKQGNQHAEARLSACYQQCFDNGTAVEGFAEWVESKAADGDIDALYIMACQLARTTGGARLSKQAANSLMPAARQGNMKAQFTLAQIYLSGTTEDEKKQAVFWLSKAAESGNPDALVLLAVAINNGTGATRDPAYAIQLLQQAADNNNIEAQAILGSLFLLGDGVPRNLTRGISLLRNAANAGSSLAQWKLALCFKNGLGTLRDPKESEKWFDKAAEGRFEQGPALNGLPGLNFSDALATFQSLASIDNRQAFYWLGVCYENGIGVPKDINKAMELYNKSANKGLQLGVEAATKLKSKMATV